MFRKLARKSWIGIRQPFLPFVGLYNFMYMSLRICTCICLRLFCYSVICLNFCTSFSFIVLSTGQVTLHVPLPLEMDYNCVFCFVCSIFRWLWWIPVLVHYLKLKVSCNTSPIRHNFMWSTSSIVTNSFIRTRSLLKMQYRESLKVRFQDCDSMEFTRFITITLDFMDHILWSLRHFQKCVTYKNVQCK